MTNNIRLADGMIVKGRGKNYRIIRLLRKSPHTNVYLAEVLTISDESTGDFVALQEFVLTRDGDSNIHDDYVRQIFALLNLRNANIQTIKESFEENGVIFYVSDYIEGNTLAECIRERGRFSESDTLRIATALCSALDYLHSRGISLLDVTPDNIILTKDNIPVIAGFGFVVGDAKEDGSASPLFLTPGYSSIERAYYRKGMGSGVAIDEYGLGAVMYAMLTGETPADAAKILNFGFPAGPLKATGVSGETISIIEKAMSPSVTKRFHALMEMQDAIMRQLYSLPHQKANNTVEVEADEKQHDSSSVTGKSDDIPITESVKTPVVSSSVIVEKVENTSENMTEERSIPDSQNMSTPPATEADTSLSPTENKPAKIVFDTASDNSADDYVLESEVLEEERISNRQKKRHLHVAVYVMAAILIIACGLILYFFLLSRSEETIENQEELGDTTEIVIPSAEDSSSMTPSAATIVPEESKAPVNDSRGRREEKKENLEESHKDENAHKNRNSEELKTSSKEVSPTNVESREPVAPQSASEHSENTGE